MTTTLSIYQFQVGKRVINIKAEDIIDAENKAIEWRNKYAKNCDLSYNWRVK